MYGHSNAPVAQQILTWFSSCRLPPSKHATPTASRSFGHARPTCTCSTWYSHPRSPCSAGRFRCCLILERIFLTSFSSFSRISMFWTFSMSWISWTFSISCSLFWPVLLWLPVHLVSVLPSLFGPPVRPVLAAGIPPTHPPFVAVDVDVPRRRCVSPPTCRTINNKEEPVRMPIDLEQRWSLLQKCSTYHRFNCWSNPFISSIKPHNHGTWCTVNTLVTSAWAWSTSTGVNKTAAAVVRQWYKA